MITLAIEGAVAVATLCRPPVNAINEAWIDRLHEALGDVEHDTAVNVLWIRSSERVFCAGADLGYMRSRFDTPHGREQMIALTRAMQQAYARIETMPKIAVAEIGGAAMGGGFELALACDLRVIADVAKVGLPEARLGLIPAAGGTQRMTRICGPSIARRLILGAEIVTGAEALELGLAHWSFPRADLEQATRAVVERLAELPAHAVRECKRCIAMAMDRGQDGYEAELVASAALLARPETQQRVRSFLDKA